MKNISILGCGWVGKALANALLTRYHVQVSVATQSSFEALPFLDKYLINNENNYFQKQFYEADTLIIAIPPRDGYLDALEKILQHVKNPTQVILYSSTSVYPQSEGNIHEEDTNTIKNPSTMLQGERYLQAIYPTSVILRLGGLMGYERITGKYTAGKTLPHDSYVNYIHRDDVVAITKQCIETKVTSDVFNAVAPLHPLKKEIFSHHAKTFGFEETYFASDEIKGKIVQSTKLQKALSYTFLHPNPLYFYK